MMEGTFRAINMPVATGISNHHIADMTEEGRVRDGCRQYGRFGQGRNLIAEIGTGDDSSRNPAFFKSLCLSDAHEGNTDSGDRCP